MFAPRNLLVRLVAGLSALALLVGALSVATVSTASAATTTTVSLAMTAGTFTTQHGTPPTALPVTPSAGFTGKETSTTGSLSTGTITFPSHENVTSEATTTIYVLQVPATKASGSVTTTGAVSIGATLEYKFHISALGGSIIQTCVSEQPVHVVLSSTAPYTATTKSVTVKNSTITVPDFGATTCSEAQKTLNKTAAGPGGELGLTLHGTLTVPPPAAPTVTSLTATPASPQVHGASVTLKGTVKKTTGATATTATGSMTFRDGTTVLATESVTGGTASYTTAALPIGTDTLTAVFGGGGGYAGSTSAALTYTVKAAPSVSVTNLPAQVTGDTATEHPFTVTLTNPSNGLAWTHLYVEVTLAGIRHLTATRAPLQYEDATGTWCSPIDLSGTTTVTGFVAVVGTTCAPAGYPASFSLSIGSASTIHFRVSYPDSGYYGAQKVTATLFTGTCSSASSCTAVAPLSGATAPTGSATVEVVPSSPLGTKMTDFATRPATSTVHKTFDVGLTSKLTPTTTPTTGLPAPTGTVTYAIDGSTVATGALHGAGDLGETPTAFFNTSGLAVGKHTLVSTYSGDQVYAPNSLTETFTVITAPTGTPFTCAISGEGAATIPAYVTATGTVPATVLVATTVLVPVSNITVTLEVDPVDDAAYYNSISQSAATLEFSPTGSPATSGPITFAGTTKTAAQVVGTWTKTPSASPITTQIALKKGTPPGTRVTVGASSISFSTSLVSWTCKPVTTAAPIGTTEIAGSALTVSPASPTTQGTPVTLTAHVYPMPTTGGTPSQVQFFDNSVSVGTALVATTGASRGTASITLSTLAVGSHSFIATWTGTPGNDIPFNASAAVAYTVNPTPPATVTPPVVTTQPTSVGVKAGQTATFTAGASGTSPSVQWQESSDGGTTWSDITGATSTTYSLTALKSDNDNEYRAVFTNGAGTATSGAATLYVTAKGYRLTASNGGVFAYGNAPFYGSAGGIHLNAPIVGSAPTPTGGGYWLVASDGGIFAFGNAQFYGSMGGQPLNEPIVGMAATPDGQGYWEVASDGGIFAFGDAVFYGSMGGKALNQPVVAMAAAPTGQGYWEVAADGGIFAFGTAPFYGSTGSLTLNKPITSMTPTPTGNGYWLVASDGGIFAFGTVQFYGTVAGTATSPVVGMLASTDGGGYLEVEANGQVVQFGDAALAGTALTQTLGGGSIVAISD